jgi:hypothetical protein
MNKQEYKSFILANKIRTLLLITIDKELAEKKNENKNILLINSKPSKNYEEKFDNYIILERAIIGSLDFNIKKTTTNFHKFFTIPRYKSIDQTIMPTKKLKISKRRNAIISIETKKNKVNDFYLKKKYETEQKLIRNSIKVLRYYCSNLKSREELKKNQVIRNNSEIIRRKKYHNNNGSKNIVLTITTPNKNRKIEFKDVKNIIQLHKMWKPKQNSKNDERKIKDSDYLNSKKDDSIISSKEELIFE